MTGGSFRKVHEHQIHQGFLIRLTDSTFEGPDGEQFHRDVVHTPNAVGVVAADRGADGRWEVVLVRQYRAAVEHEVIEIPAGMCDVPGEPPEQTAQRELAEEAGFRARVVRPLTSFHPAPGFTTHHTTIVLGIGLDPVGRSAHGIEEDHMTVDRVPLDVAVEQVRTGEISDAKSMIGLLLAHAHLAG